ncbi:MULTISPECIES: retropepsin-like aspartic protease [Paenibacillus]|jgi:predicted aspartyl protease|uniref:retropepsin-like aspartic protease n=1 Tax=Paenibacillus TaxID=44249 RepID=UPI000FDA7AE4|nr:MULTISPECIES: retropepsin-like aspartic protease [Paenibacillus]MDU0332259.1 retropepsin-like aspartic protease [Paenibacillus sp. 3LSP]
MKFEYRDGLLFTTILLSYEGRSKTIDNIVIDTGASHTLISQDAVDDLGIRVQAGDEIYTSYGIGGKEHSYVKKVDSIQIAELKIENAFIDFMSFPYEHINGLLGLDILMEGKFKIDLNTLELRLQ